MEPLLRPAQLEATTRLRGLRNISLDIIILSDNNGRVRLSRMWTPLVAEKERTATLSALSIVSSDSDESFHNAYAFKSAATESAFPCIGSKSEMVYHC